MNKPPADDETENGSGTARAVRIAPPHREPDADSAPRAHDTPGEIPGMDADDQADDQANDQANDQKEPADEAEEQETGDTSLWMDGAHAAGAELPPE